MITFLKGRWDAIVCAFKGAVKLIRTEKSVQTQFAVGILTCLLGWYMEISSTEWLLQLLAIGLVIGLEGMNSAIEAICDFIHPDFNKHIGFIKDISAGAVFIAASIAVIIGLIIYLPKLLPSVL